MTPDEIRRREYERAVIMLRLACDAEIQALRNGRSPDQGLVLMMEMGQVTKVFETIRQAWNCGYCRDRPSSLVPCPECGS